MERHFRHSLDRSLKVVCACPDLKKKKYTCEYKGNPHFLGGGYVKEAVAFYKEVAQFVSSELFMAHIATIYYYHYTNLTFVCVCVCTGAERSPEAIWPEPKKSLSLHRCT